jgi:folate-binding protein YgfZ
METRSVRECPSVDSGEIEICQESGVPRSRFEVSRRSLCPQIQYGEGFDRLEAYPTKDDTLGGKLTVANEWQQWLTQQGAQWAETPDGHGDLPESFGHPHAEYTWIQTESFWCPRPDVGWLEVTGRDRAKFLHNFCTQDVRGLVPGAGAEAFITTVQGKVFAHVFLFAGHDSLWIANLGSPVSRLLAHLDKYRITEDVEFHDRSATRASLLVSGPDAEDKLVGLGLAAASLGPLNHFWTDLPTAADSSVRVHVARVDWLGQPGYLLSFDADSGLESLLCRAATALTARGIHPVGQAAFEAARIEACFPWYGQDFSEANLAQEIQRTAQAISFTKGCYLGQEPIARIDALGHVNQQLRGVRLSRGPVPLPGTPIFPPGGGDKPIGKITSATISFADDQPVALALMRRGSDRPGLQVVVHQEQGLSPATLFWAEHEA